MYDSYDHLCVVCGRGCGQDTGDKRDYVAAGAVEVVCSPGGVGFPYRRCLGSLVVAL